MGDEPLALNDEEAKLADELAKRFGLTRREAAERAVSSGMARRFKKRTGKNPAKVYRITKR